MNPPDADPIPRLSEACPPPEVIGLASLTTAAMHGANPDTLAGMIARHDTDQAARLYDSAIALQLAFRRAEGLDRLDEALALSRLFRTRRDAAAPAALRVLALMAPGELMANTPLDFITNHLDVRLDLLFVRPGEALPTVLPNHDVAFFAAGDADTAMVARLHALFAAWPRPALNDPALLPMLARDRLASLLAGLPTVCSPSAAAATRAQLDALLRTYGNLGRKWPGLEWPVLVRPLDSHAGRGLKLIAGPQELAAYLMFSFEPAYFVTRFVDYRSADSLYRKYRVAFFDRRPWLCHMASSQHWMVHYLNAGMTESADKRAAEADAMAQFDASFARRHDAAFAALQDLLPFDYFSIDCGELPDGRLIVFEADTAAIIHLMDQQAMFPYKHVQMRRVFAAFEAMLHVRAAASGCATGRVLPDASHRAGEGETRTLPATGIPMSADRI